MKRYLKRVDGRLIEHFGKRPEAAWFAENGWIAYTGKLPLSRLDIVGGAVVELPKPEPAEEWVNKAAFVDAITALIPDELKPAIAADWRTLAAIAQLPGEHVDLKDARVSAFLTEAGLDMSAIRAAMEAADGN